MRRPTMLHSQPKLPKQAPGVLIERGEFDLDDVLTGAYHEISLKVIVFVYGMRPLKTEIYLPGCVDLGDPDAEFRRWI